MIDTEHILLFLAYLVGVFVVAIIIRTSVVELNNFPIFPTLPANLFGLEQSASSAKFTALTTMHVCN